MAPSLHRCGVGLRPSTPLLALAVGAAARPTRAAVSAISTATMNTDMNSAALSGNWSGYASIAPAGSTFTAIVGNWTVPAVTGSPTSDTYSCTWIGIDGYNSSTVEQIGTESNYVGGVATYYPWVEYYPDPQINLSADFTVKAGDSMSAEITYQGVVTGAPGTLNLGDYSLLLTLIDNTDAANPDYKGPYDGINYTYYSVTAPDLSSAEWITEAPGLTMDDITTESTLADYGTVTFTGAAAQLTTGDANDVETISGFNSTAIDMVQGGQIVSTASALSDGGDTFSTVYASPVPEPASLGMLALGGVALLCRRRNR